MKFWILLAIAGLLLLWSLRERFEATSTIRAPPYDENEKIRIYNMLPVGTASTLMTRARSQFPNETTDRGRTIKAAEYVTPAIASFFTTVYTPRNTTLTVADVDTFMANRTGDLKSAEKDAIVAYFINQAGIQSSGYLDILAGLGQTYQYQTPGTGGTTAAGTTGATTTGTTTTGATTTGAAGTTTTGAAGTTTTASTAGAAATTAAAAAAATTGTAAAAPNLIKAPPYDRAEQQRIFNMLRAQEKAALNRIARATGGSQATGTELAANVVRGFYVSVYSRATSPITQEQIDRYVRFGPEMPGDNKEIYTRLLTAYYINQQPPRTSTTAATAQTSGTTTGGTSATSFGPTSGGPTSRLRQVFGPVFAGGGGGGAGSGGDTSRTNVYPELLGGRIDTSTRIPGVGVVSPSQNWQLSQNGSLPSTGSLGVDDNARFFPYSRQPGDMDIIPDPYRVSQTFSQASYSSKTEPVPFLTDFSAFLR